jgi:hypothetical protein
MTTTALTLYEAEDNLLALLNSLEIAEGMAQEAEVLEEIRTAWLAAAEKRDRVCQFLAHLEAQQEFAAAEMKRLKERKDQMERIQERLEGYVVQVIRSFGLDAKNRYPKLEGLTSTLSIRSCPDSVKILDESLVPLEFKTVTISETVDKRAIGARLDTGASVPGADLATGKFRLVRT